jgi:hypothetical protein
MIYNFALSGHYISLEDLSGDEVHICMECCADTDHKHDLRNLLALPASCRQLHAETQDIIFTASEFGVTMCSEADMLINKLMPNQRAIIRKLRLRYCHFECYTYCTTAVSFGQLQGLEEVVVVADWGDGQDRQSIIAKLKDGIILKAGRPVRVDLVERPSLWEQEVTDRWT